MTFNGATDLEICENKNNIYNGKISCHYGNGKIENQLWRNDEEVWKLEVSKENLFYARDGSIIKALDEKGAE